MKLSLRHSILLILLSFLFPLTGETGQTLTLSFTGDLMAHNINYDMDDYEKIYHGLEGIFQEDDLTFGNVEFPMDPDRAMASFPSFNIHPIYVEAFINAGLDVFSLANNHTNDIGMRALKATINASRELADKAGHPVYFSGAVIDPIVPVVPEEWIDFPITIIEKKGWKIGFLALTQMSNASPIEDGVLHILNYNNSKMKTALLEQISRIDGEYDLLVLSYHGGIEYNFVPDLRKKVFFNELVAAGVDVVWSHHPHILQEMELVETDFGTKAILYSMGNFLSGQGGIIDETLPEEEWSYVGDSAIVQLKIEMNEDGYASVKHLYPIAVANYITPNREVLLYPLETLVTMALPSPWDEFYRERRRLMEGFFREKLIQSRL